MLVLMSYKNSSVQSGLAALIDIQSYEMKGIAFIFQLRCLTLVAEKIQETSVTMSFHGASVRIAGFP